MIARVVLLTDGLVGLLVLLDHRVLQFGILNLQLFAGKVLQDAGAERVAQHVGGGTQAVPTEARDTVEMYRQATHFCISINQHSHPQI